MRRVYRVVGVDEQADKILLLCLIGFVKLLEGVHFRDVARIGADFYALIHTVGKNQLHRAAHIEKRRVVPAVRLSALLRLHAADDAVIPRVLQREPARHNGRNNHLVVIIRGEPRTQPRQSRRFD